MLFQDVDNDEEADPNDVNEVPVVRNDDCAGRFLVAKVLCCVGAANDQQEGDQAACNVQRVKTSGDVAGELPVLRG